MCEQNKAKEAEYQQKAMEHDMSDIPETGFRPAAFLRQAFADMKESARAQWEEAKAMGRPETRKAALQAQRDQQIEEANQRIAEAEARIRAAKGEA